MLTNYVLNYDGHVQMNLCICLQSRNCQNNRYGWLSEIEVVDTRDGEFQMLFRKNLAMTNIPLSLQQIKSKSSYMI